MALPEQSQYLSGLLISTVREYNPDTGASIVLTYLCKTDTQVLLVRNYWEALSDAEGTPLGYGYRTTTSKTAQGEHVVVRIPDAQLFIDRWNLQTETVQDPIWYSDEIRSYLVRQEGDPSFAALNLTTLSHLKRWLQQVRAITGGVRALQVGEDPEPIFRAIDIEVTGGTQVLLARQEDWNIMFQMMRDGDYIERVRPVLRRNRTLPVGSGETRTTITGRPLIYYTADLITVFGLPDETIDQIADVDIGLPTAPPNTVWSWKLRLNDSDYVIGANKIMECRDWVFGRWSTITNELYGA
jgi:hypothetical protein